MRLFVAVRPPTKELPEVRDPHVTLCFLGEVDDALVDEVAAALRAGLVDARCCDAVVEGGSPRSLGHSALVRRVRGLDDVAAAVRAAVGDYAARPEHRPFRGHLTVARRRRGARSPSSSASSPAADDAGRGEVRWRVEEVVLVRSELGRGPGGTARHSVVASVRLREGDGAGAPPLGP